MARRIDGYIKEVVQIEKKAITDFCFLSKFMYSNYKMALFVICSEIKLNKYGNCYLFKLRAACLFVDVPQLAILKIFPIYNFFLILNILNKYSSKW